VPAPDTSVTYRGYELPLVEVGIEIATKRRFTVGPYATASLGRFQRAEIEGLARQDEPIRITDRAIHSWFQFGMRAAFRP
jgi:hypothetical protein